MGGISRWVSSLTESHRLVSVGEAQTVGVGHVSDGGGSRVCDSKETSAGSDGGTKGSGEGRSVSTGGVRSRGVCGRGVRGVSVGGGGVSEGSSDLSDSRGVGDGVVADTGVVLPHAGVSGVDSLAVGGDGRVAVSRTDDALGLGANSGGVVKGGGVSQGRGVADSGGGVTQGGANEASVSGSQEGGEDDELKKFANG